MQLSSVYWLHLEEHSDFTTQGYIGVTSKTPLERFKQHVALSKNGVLTLSKAIQKYGEKLIVTTLLKGTDDYCYLMELKIRPSERIGWNIVAGGGKPPVKNTPHTEEAKKKISVASIRTANTPSRVAYKLSMLGKSRSAEAKINMSNAQSGKLPWECSRVNKDIWCMADLVFEVYTGKPCGSKALEKRFLLNRGALDAILKKLKQNWNPNSDPSWVEWVQSYKLINKELQ